MSGTATNRCCCDCSGMGLPIFTDWKVNRGAWAGGSSYAVGDLVFSGAPAAYYVCTQAHYAADVSVQPPNATYWTVADRALKCLYLEIANIGFKDCMSLVGIEDGETETTTGPRVRLSEYSIWMPDKWLLRQRKPFPDAEGYQNRLLYLYGGGIGTGCWWSHLCDCDSEIYTEVVTVQTQVGLITTYTDSYHSAFTIQAVFTETEVEVVIFGGLFPYSSGADGAYTPEVGTHTPCKHPTLWMSVEMELFRGKASIPAGWIDAYGEASSTITISNDWSCSDIGTVLEPGTVPTGHIRPLGRRIVGAGGGTVNSPRHTPWAGRTISATRWSVAARCRRATRAIRRSLPRLGVLTAAPEGEAEEVVAEGAEVSPRRHRLRPSDGMPPSINAAVAAMANGWTTGHSRRAPSSWSKTPSARLSVWSYLET